MKQSFGGRNPARCVAAFLYDNVGRNKFVSRRKLADDFLVDDKTVARWLTDGVNKLDLVADFADYFNVEMTYIICYGEDDVCHPYSVESIFIFIFRYKSIDFYVNVIYNKYILDYSLCN